MSYMREIHEPGDSILTMTARGEVRVWVIGDDGEPTEVEPGGGAWRAVAGERMDLG